MYNFTTGELNLGICHECKQILLFCGDDRTHYCLQTTDASSLVMSSNTFPVDYGVKKAYSKVIGHIKYNDR